MLRNVAPWKGNGTNSGNFPLRRSVKLVFVRSRISLPACVPSDRERNIERGLSRAGRVNRAAQRRFLANSQRAKAERVEFLAGIPFYAAIAASHTIRFDSIRFDSVRFGSARFEAIRSIFLALANNFPRYGQKPIARSNTIYCL